MSTGERAGRATPSSSFSSARPSRKRAAILEIGCGKGVLLGKFLKNHPGWSAYAVEPSLNATEYFKKILPEVAIHEGPFETAPFRDRKFDLVAVSGVLEHVPRPSGVPRARRRRARAGRTRLHRRPQLSRQT